MKPREAANYLGLAENTLAKNRAGVADIPYIRIGGSIRYDRTALDEYMKMKGIRQ
jgi:excisionase family DNA binding protein